MNVFQGSRNINEVFKKKLDIIQKKLNEYDYKQLKEFSKDEIEIISSLGEIENIIIDFDNPIFSTKRGSMRVKNAFRFSQFEKEFFDVDALEVFVKIPILQGVDIIDYSGNPTTFTMSAMSVDMELLRESGTDDHYLTFTMKFRLSEMEKKTPEEQKTIVQKEYDDHIYGAKFYYAPFRSEIERFNRSLVDRTQKYVDEIIRKDSVLDMFSKAIGVEVTPKNVDREKGKKIIVTPKKILTNLPDKKTYDGYYFDNANYNSILQTIREHLIATENLPKPIQKLSDEELIRDTILWALNANYIVATGETFRAAGKTDINVNIDRKSAFIAECKVWHGPNTFSDALSQIFSYSTWRECRIAILIFNLSLKNFGGLIAKLDEQIKLNSSYVSSIKKYDNEWECKFRKPSDENDLITVNVIVSDYCLRKEK